MSKFLKFSILFISLIQMVEAGRYYDNEHGRFIQRDPLGYVDGMSLYNAYFAEGFALDPSGLKITGTGKLPANEKGVIVEYDITKEDVTFYFTIPKNVECDCEEFNIIQIFKVDYDWGDGDDVTDWTIDDGTWQGSAQFNSSWFRSSSFDVVL